MSINKNIDIVDEVTLRLLDKVHGVRLGILKDVILTVYYIFDNEYIKLHDFHAMRTEQILRNPFEYNKEKEYTIYRIRNLESLGLVDYKDSSFGDNFQEVFITNEGSKVVERIEQDRRPIIRPPREDRDEVFIASAFGYDDVDYLFEDELVPSCEQLGLEPIRVDREEPKQTITHAILNGITEAECVIADLTYARPSVYFEAGFAHGQGIPLLLTCREDHYRSDEDDRRVHFDLEQYKISFWKYEDGKFVWPDEMSPEERISSLTSKQ